jgi:hypothetical protein
MATKIKKPKAFSVPTGGIFGLGTQAGAPPPKGGAAAQRPYGTTYSPYVTPSEAPQGSYDPQLDTQGETEQLGYGLTTDAYDEGNVEAGQDYTNNIGDINRNYAQTLSDLQTQHQRNEQDYATQTQDLGTSYQRLGSSQTQNANAAGVGSGGALVAAMQARQGNQATAQSKLDVARQRTNENILTAGQKAGALALLQTRDATEAADRSKYAREHTQFGVGGTHDIYTKGLTNAKITSAQQAGMLPTPPSNAHLNAQGVEDYATVYNTHKGTIYHKYPDGRLVAVGNTGKGTDKGK